MRYVIMLYRVRDNYVTLLDVFRTVLSSGAFEKMWGERGRCFASSSFPMISKVDYAKHETFLAPFMFTWEDFAQYLCSLVGWRVAD